MSSVPACRTDQSVTNRVTGPRIRGLSHNRQSSLPAAHSELQKGACIWLQCCYCMLGLTCTIDDRCLNGPCLNGKQNSESQPGLSSLLLMRPPNNMEPHTYRLAKCRQSQQCHPIPCQGLVNDTTSSRRELSATSACQTPTNKGCHTTSMFIVSWSSSSCCSSCQGQNPQLLPWVLGTRSRSAGSHPLPLSQWSVRQVPQPGTALGRCVRSGWQAWPCWGTSTH